MGARLQQETSIVAQALFVAIDGAVATLAQMPCPRRRRARACALIVALLGLGAAGCSSDRDGGTSRPTGTPDEVDVTALCRQLDVLATRADPVAAADVADPDTFTRTLDDAVDQYVADLRTLDEIAPEALHDAIDDVSRAMRRRDFAAALTARAPLDAFSAAECGAASTTTTVAPTAG